MSLDKYFSFKEEAGRSEFWAVNLITWFGSWLILIFGLITAGMFTYLSDLLGGLIGLIAVFGTISLGIYLILAVGARRCNEANISRWWIVLLLIPFFGFIMTIVLGVLPPDSNRIRIQVNDKT